MIFSKMVILHGTHNLVDAALVETVLGKERREVLLQLLGLRLRKFESLGIFARVVEIILVVLPAIVCHVPAAFEPAFLLREPAVVVVDLLVNNFRAAADVAPLGLDVL